MDNLNKLLGFYELKDSGLPTIPWEEYNDQTTFSSNYLWTIRTAVLSGNDISLPRAVGVDSAIAKEKAGIFKDRLRDNGIVIYYPYFIAEKSGNLNVYGDKVIIEAVKKDLWNLVNFDDREVTVIQENNSLEFLGNEDFLNDSELKEINKYVNEVRRIFRRYLLEGKNIMLEWSYAYNTDVSHNPIGEKYLVFYEARTT
jgi:hypothetical protein